MSSTSEILVNNGINTIDKLLSITKNEMIKMGGIGPIKAEAIYNSLQTKKNTIIELGNFITFKDKENGLLSGMSFCFTGALDIKRGDAQKLVLSEGGTVKNNVSKGLTYLVQSNPKSNSTKSQKARKYGTKIIDEEEFLSMINFTFDKLQALHQNKFNT